MKWEGLKQAKFPWKRGKFALLYYYKRPHPNILVILGGKTDNNEEILDYYRIDHISRGGSVGADDLYMDWIICC